MNLNPVAKMFMVAGLTLIVVGIAWQLGLISNLRLGRLPGDIVIQRENTTIYIPIVTMLLLSLVLSAISWIFRR